MILRRARIELTISFALVQLVLFAAFAVAIYLYVTTTFDFDVVDREGDAVTAEAGFETLRTALVLAYAALVLIVPVTSYALASLALRPVRIGFEAQRRFVDDASHEFRTPLSVIQAQLELSLSRPRSGAEYRGAMQTSMLAVGRLARILDESLALTRSMRDVPDRRIVTIGEIVDDVRSQVPILSVGRLVVAGTLDALVDGSPTMLGRAVLNLVANALRYSPDGSLVEISVTRRLRTVRVVVADRGPGMPARDRRRAFERFWRADASRAVEGSGLGLSIVEAIAAAHHGRVRLRARNGGGIAAELVLPLSR